MKRDYRSLAKEWFTSGLTQKEFCQKHQIVLPTLQYWTSKLRRETTPVKSFVELVPPVAADCCMELHLPNGCKLIFFDKPEAAFVKSMLR